VAHLATHGSKGVSMMWRMGVWPVLAIGCSYTSDSDDGEPGETGGDPPLCFLGSMR